MPFQSDPIDPRRKVGVRSSNEALAERFAIPHAVAVYVLPKQYAETEIDRHRLHK